MSNQTKKKPEQKETRRQYSHGMLTVLAILMFVGFAVIVIFSSKAEKTLNERRQEAIEQASSTPEPTPEIIDDEIIDSEIVDDSEQGQSNLEDQFAQDSGDYANIARLFCSTGEGKTLSVGLLNEQLTDGLYLDLDFEDVYSTSAYPKYGYIIQADDGIIEYSGDNPCDILQGDNTYEKNLFVAGRTYDKCTPAAFRSTNDYGVRWVGYDGLSMSGFERTTLHIRVVSLASAIEDPTNPEHFPDGYLLGVAKLDVVYDNATGTYRIENLRTADVLNDYELGEEKREAMIDVAIQYIQAGTDKYRFSVSDEIQHDPRESGIVVEKLKYTYYPRLFNSKSKVVASGEIKASEIYAVNIPDEYYGYFTVYFGPLSQLRGSSDPIADPNEEDYAVVGYDPPLPHSLEYLKATMLQSDYDSFYFDDEFMYG